MFRHGICIESLGRQENLFSSMEYRELESQCQIKRGGAGQSHASGVEPTIALQGWIVSGAPQEFALQS
jgi:hypothetical protein